MKLPSSNEDQMEFRYKHWCGRAERGRTRAPPCRRYSGGTSYGAGGPQSPTRTIITNALSWGCWSPGPKSLPDQNNGDRPRLQKGRELGCVVSIELHYPSIESSTALEEVAGRISRWDPQTLTQEATKAVQSDDR